MACFPDGFFKDPAKDKTHLIELVANYSRNVPELLPALRDVINYGMLYDQKLKAFLDLLNQERKRQKSLSAGGSSQTDYVENDENISIRSTETPMEEGSSVKKKKKKKKKHEEEAREETETDETVIDQTAVGHTENAENVCPNEEGPPVKKKKNKNKKAQTRDYDSSASADSQPLQENGHSEVSSVAGGRSSSADEVKPKNEVKGEEPKHEVKEEDEPDVTTIDENVLINTVVGDQSETCCTSFSVSKSENAPRKRNILDSETGPSASTPFRVIPSVQLMEDPARFPDLAPTPAETTQTETSSEPMKKWRVLFEFDCRLVGSSWTLTAAEVRTALEKFGLRNIQVLQLEMTEIGTYFVKVECFSADFHSAVQFSGSSDEGAPSVIEVSQIIDGHKFKETDNLAGFDSEAQASSLVNFPPPGGDAVRSNGGILNSGVVNSRADAFDIILPQSSGNGTVPLNLGVEPQQSVMSCQNEESTQQSNEQRLNTELIKRLLEPSTVDWVMKACISTKKDRRLFKEWLDVQKKSLPLDSFTDNGSILFKPPQHWVKEFKKWLEQKEKANVGNRSLPSSDRELDAGSDISNRDCPSTSGSVMTSSTVLTGNISAQRNFDDIRREQPSNSSQASHDSVEQKASPARYRSSLNSRIIALLKADDRNGYNYWCVRPSIMSLLMEKHIPSYQHKRFLTWLDHQKEVILANPHFISGHALFRGFRHAQFWFDEFYNWTMKRYKILPPKMERPNHRPQDGRDGLQGSQNKKFPDRRKRMR